MISQAYVKTYVKLFCTVVIGCLFAVLLFLLNYKSTVPVPHTLLTWLYIWVIKIKQSCCCVGFLAEKLRLN